MTIPETRWPTRGRGRALAPLSARPCRPARARKPDVGAGDGAVARDRRRLRHARRSRLVRALRRGAAGRARRRGDRHPRRPERAAAAHRPRPLRARACASSSRPCARASGGADAALHPDHRLPLRQAPARAGEVLRALPRRSPSATGARSPKRPATTAGSRADEADVRAFLADARRTRCWSACSTSASSRRCASATASASPTRTCRTSASCRECCPALRRRGRARARGRLRRRRAALRARLHDGVVPLARNTRADGYGGARENRVRLPLEVYARGARARRRRLRRRLRFLGDEVIDGRQPRRRRGLLRRRVRARRASTSSRSRRAASSRTRSSRRSAQPSTRTRARAATSACRRCISDARGPFGRNVPLVARDQRAVRDAGFETPVVARGRHRDLRAGRSDPATRRGRHRRRARASRSPIPTGSSKMRLGRGAEVRRCTFTNYCEALDQMHKQVTCKLWDSENLDEPGNLL